MSRTSSPTSSVGSRQLASLIPELAPEGELAQVPIGNFTTEAGAVLGDASPVTIPLTGDLTIHGETQNVTTDFQVVRDGDSIILGGDIPINRLDFGVETPEMIAAKISEVGEVNVRVTLQK